MGNPFGRNRKPTQLKIVDGTLRPRDGREREPTPPLGCAMPPGLSAPAQEHWKRIARELNRAKILARTDADGLRLLCETLAEYDQADAIVQKHGLLVRAGGPGTAAVPNPALSIRRNASERARKWLAHYGLTPSARAAVSREDDDLDDPDYRAWADLDALDDVGPSHDDLLDAQSDEETEQKKPRRTRAKGKRTAAMAGDRAESQAGGSTTSSESTASS